MTIHENLRNLRMAAGLTQEQAAEQLGITRQGLSSYETGRTMPDVEMLKRLAELYHTDLETLIYGQDRNAKSYRTIKRVSIALYVTLAVLTLLSSAALWVSNRFFPMADGPVIMSVFEVRKRLTSVWETADGIILTLAFLGFAFLLVFCAGRRCRYGWKTRLAASGIFAATILVIAFVVGITDPIYHVNNYLFTPTFVIARLIVFFLLDLLIERIQKRRKD